MPLTKQLFGTDPFGEHDKRPCAGISGCEEGEEFSVGGRKLRVVSCANDASWCLGEQPSLQPWPWCPSRGSLLLRINR